MITYLKDRAADIADQARERVREITTMRIETPATSQSIGRAAVLIVVFVAAIGAVTWVYTWHVKRERDQHWRDKIASASQHVRGAVEAGSKDAAAADEIAIKALGDIDDHYRSALEDLSRARHLAKALAAERSECRPVPAHCLTTGSIGAPAAAPGGLRK